MNLDYVAEIHCTLTSKAGYPIYDLMKNIRPSDGHGGYVSGYVGASGRIFYTENEAILKEFNSLSTTQEQKDFIKSHPECLMHEKDVAQMSHNESKAYNHLITPERLQQTLKKQYYGCAYLLEGESLLIFHQSKLRDIYHDKIDLTNKYDFKNASLKLLDKYEAGSVLPEAKIEGFAFKKIKEVLKDYIMIPSVDKNHALKEELELALNFANHYGIKIDIQYISNNEANLSIKDNEKTLKEYNLSKDDTLRVAHEKTTLKDLLKDIYEGSKILDNKIDQLLKNKPKMK